MLEKMESKAAAEHFSQKSFQSNTLNVNLPELPQQKTIPKIEKKNRHLQQKQVLQREANLKNLSSNQNSIHSKISDFKGNVSEAYSLDKTAPYPLRLESR